ncbi:MAG: RluA family pseudouridine synthase [Chloroflexi bacterium]|jgi:23S rRNA pseudouridine1911/1915/1917 synthase|nr:RluA family pseudouridine synthase [Chloroflexota bacterium]
MQHTFTVPEQAHGERLDKFLTDQLEARGVALSRARVQRLIKEGAVRLNGKPEKPAYRLAKGDQLDVQLTPELLAPDLNCALQPEPLPLRILYCDSDIAAIDKPAGMVVHPAAGNVRGTLVNALLARFPQVASVGGENRAGIVHRLDKETSGVILVALSEAARLHLMAQFAARAVQKRYLALVDGAPNTLSGIINAPIGRDPAQRKRMAVLPTHRGGREAISQFQVLERFAQHTLLEVLPQTGRTHQIRVHLAFIGCPVVGDSVYGRRKPTLKLGRHFLHAESIVFRNLAGEQVRVQAPLPPELARALAALRAANT